MSESNGLPQDVLINIPDNLPVPDDDGACDHLPGLALPSLALPSTSGTSLDLSSLSGWTVVYCYPMTGTPGRAIPEGWTAVPGAAGCTPQSHSFRENYPRFQSLGVHVFGMSTQSTADQTEAAQRLQLPYALLSDSGHAFSAALNLPLFDIAGMRLLKRITLILRDGKVVKHFYPVFPPDQNAGDVLAWLDAHL
ncbi:peroxiredoxin [Oxalobacteraceae bacterium]|nr:peroxiredoxin [Oxalobacteraceae bacterium]